VSLGIHAQIERETNATIKLILFHMEQLAELEPRDAVEPYAFEARRQVVMRKVWTLVKQCMKHVPRPQFEV
jgi:hypothetical protein